MTTTAKREIVLTIGGVYASDEPVVLKTLLGSCIAVCLYDPRARVGGMNHFALPDAAGIDARTATRFGVNAVETLIRRMLHHGAARARLVAKIFGGGRIMEIGVSHDDVAQRNIRFARAALATEGFAIVAEDVGGRQARQLRFHTESGRAFVRHLERSSMALDERHA